MDMKSNIDDTRIALISNDIGYIKEDISEIKVGIKSLDGVYATQEQLRDLTKQVDKLAMTLQKNMEKQSGLQRFIPALFSSVLTGVLVFLIISFITNVK